MSQSTPVGLHYTADYWPGMHTTAFSLVRVNARKQREELCGFLAAPEIQDNAWLWRLTALLFLHRVSAASRSLKIYCTVLQHTTNCHSTSLSLCLYLPLFVLNATSAPTSSPSFSPLILFRRGAHSIILSARISVCPSFPPLLSAAEWERRGMGRAGERKERWTD